MIALNAVSSAIDSYQENKGNFWSYASVVIKNRLIDYYRSERRHDQEIAASPNVFDGTTDYEDPEYALQEQVTESHSIRPDDSLKLEIQALNEELAAYDISFFDLAASSPKAAKTRSKCAQIIKAFFLPPPLTRYLEEKRRFPAAQINKRVKNAKKCVERYKKYLICIVVIIRGDYPHIAEYISYITDEMKEGKEGEH